MTSMVIKQDHSLHRCANFFSAHQTAASLFALLKDIETTLTSCSTPKLSIARRTALSACVLTTIPVYLMRTTALPKKKFSHGVKI